MKGGININAITIIAFVILTSINIFLSVKVAKMEYKSTGNIVLSDEGIYLSMDRDELKFLEKADYVTLKVNRKNFKGFNE